MSDSRNPQPEPNQGRQQRVGSGISAAQLRAEFDRSFALRAQPPTGAARNFVILQVSGREFALPAAGLAAIERTVGDGSGHSINRELPPEEMFGDNLIEPAGVHDAAQWVRVPSSQPALLGIRAFNGRIVPGFALATLLGLGAPAEPAYCAIISVGPDQIGFAFDALLRFARVEPEQMLPAGPAAEPWQTGTVLDQGRPLAVIGIAPLLQLIAPNRPLADDPPTLTLQDGE